MKGEHQKKIQTNIVNINKDSREIEKYLMEGDEKSISYKTL